MLRILWSLLLLLYVFSCNIIVLQMSHQPPQSVGVQAVWLCIALAMILGTSVASPPNRSPALLSHHFARRSFFDIQCKGAYDQSIFARLDRICEDCYNLFREPQLHSLCRKDCFTTEIFKGCLETLQLTDEIEQVQNWIKQIHGADPGV